VGNGQYATYYALFDTGSHPPSFISRKLAAWVVANMSHDQKREDERQDKGAVRALTLASTAQTTHVYGCVVFNLTLSVVNEVTNNPETVFSIKV